MTGGLSTQLMKRTRALEKRFYATGRILTHTALMLLLSGVALAQSPPTIDAKAWHGFAAIAPLSMTNDSQDRLTRSRLADQSFWLVDSAGARLTDQVDSAQRSREVHAG